MKFMIPWHESINKVEEVDALVNTLKPKQNDQKLADDILKCIFLSGTYYIFILISLKLVPKGLLHNKSALAGLILGLRPANERLCYFVTTSLIGCTRA